MQKTGQITRWDAERAFGFIRSPDSVADVFFHVRDFQGPAAPRMGMAVVFEEIHVGGKGPRAMAVRPSAQAVGAPGRAADPRGAGSAASREAPQSARRGPSAAQRTTGAHPRAASRPAAQVRRRTQRVTSLPAGELLLISAMAVVWMAMLAWAVWAQRLPLWAVGAALGLNLFTFLVYASDKSAAQRGMWRTKESHLHLLALAGGWPAAWLAQQTLRHKSQKAAFRAVYALTVVAHCGALAAWLLGLVG